MFWQYLLSITRQSFKPCSHLVRFEHYSLLVCKKEERWGFLIYPFRNKREKLQAILIQCIPYYPRWIPSSNKKREMDFYHLLANFSRKTLQKQILNQFLEKTKCKYNPVLRCVNLESYFKIRCLLELITGNWIFFFFLILRWKNQNFNPLLPIVASHFICCVNQTIGLF